MPVRSSTNRRLVIDSRVTSKSALTITISSNTVLQHKHAKTLTATSVKRKKKSLVAQPILTAKKNNRRRCLLLSAATTKPTAVVVVVQSNRTKGPQFSE